MINKIVYAVLIATMVMLGACSSDDILPEPKPEVKPETGRTISLTATIAKDEPTTASLHGDDPTTRVSLNQNGKKIEVRWEVGDDIEFAFVQGNNLLLDFVKVDRISNEGNTAHFDIPIPDGWTGQFMLYGVYGYYKMSTTGRAPNQPIISLPTNLQDATSLNGPSESIQSREDVVIYFEHAMNADDTNAQVTFNHLGSLFCITVKNNSPASLTDLKEIELNGMTPSNESWAYNGGGSYNLITQNFTGVSHTNQLKFKTTSRTLLAGESLTYWGWNPPMGKIWPELKLSMKWAEINSYAATVNPKAARTAPTPVGKTYYFYAMWNGSQLLFTNSSFTPPASEGEFEVPLANLTTTQKAATTKITVTGMLTKADFDVMKNEMPSLVSIDLSGATCVGNKIPDYAFGSRLEPASAANKNITTVILPPSATTIGVNAFKDCIGLTTLTMPTSLGTIGKSAFNGCSSLAGTLTLPAGLTTIGESAFENCDKLTGDLALPAGLTSMGEKAFLNCTGFNGNLTMPANMPLTAIGQETFSNTGFTGTLTLPNNLKTIGFQAFFNCSNLTGLLFSNTGSTGLTTISEKAFMSCTSITGKIIFPISLTGIGAQGFCSCLNVGAFRFPHLKPIAYTTGMLCKTGVEGESYHNVEVPSAEVLTLYRAETAIGWIGFPVGNITVYNN